MVPKDWIPEKIIVRYTLIIYNIYKTIFSEDSEKQTDQRGSQIPLGIFPDMVNRLGGQAKPPTSIQKFSYTFVIFNDNILKAFVFDQLKVKALSESEVYILAKK